MAPLRPSCCAQSRRSPSSRRNPRCQFSSGYFTDHAFHSHITAHTFFVRHKTPIGDHGRRCECKDRLQAMCKAILRGAITVVRVRVASVLRQACVCIWCIRHVALMCMCPRAFGLCVHSVSALRSTRRAAGNGRRRDIGWLWVAAACCRRHGAAERLKASAIWACRGKARARWRAARGCEVGAPVAFAAADAAELGNDPSLPLRRYREPSTIGRDGQDGQDSQ